MSVKEKTAATGPSRPSVVVERTYRAGVQELWELWTTKDGFESWWGPEGFRVEVQAMEARPGGELRYDMIADTPEMVQAMKDMDRPASHGTRGWFEQITPQQRLVLKHLIDFLPGVTAYESTIVAEFFPTQDGHTRMVVTFSPMHDEETSQMQKQGFASQLTKLDRRFGVVR